ncbi:C-GCAxxG-C-C family protein [Eubacteriaceae bacterium ES2]|nr:C-GCAxxG-C-C family protein [Eubacteriaceae bacterium ES2]
MNKSEEALDLFSQGFNCTQVILSVFGDEFGLDREAALKMACGFGGGLCQGELCGAVSGAVMVLGLKYGQCEKEDHDAKEKTYDVVNAFCKQFKAINGSIICNDLLDTDLSQENARKIARENGLFKKVCPKVIADAVLILEKFI